MGFVHKMAGHALTQPSSSPQNLISEKPVWLGVCRLLGAQITAKEMVVASLRRRRVGIMVRDLDGELIILDTEADRIHQLNRTAGFIWRNLDEAPAPERLAGLLAEEFDVEAHVALTDVLETLQRFRGLNLVLNG